MATDDKIVAKFTADISEYKAKLVELEGQLNKLSDTQKDTATEQKKTSAELASASNKRKLALQNEQAELKRLQASLKAAFTVKDIETFNQKIAQTKQNISTLKGEAGGLQKSLGGLSGSFSAIGAGIAAAFTVQAVINLAKSVIDVTANFQKMSAVLTNTLGSESAAKKAIEDIQAFAEQTPFSVSELTASFVKLANQGFKPTTAELRKLGDLASSTGKSFDQLAEAIIDAQTGEFERLKEFGIRAQKEGDKVIFSFKGIQTQTDFTSEAIRNYVLSLGDAVGVTGSMEAISKTLGGRISNMGDAWENFLKTLGGQTSGVFATTIQGLTDFINAITTSFADPAELSKKAVNKAVENAAASLKTEIDQAIKSGKTFEDAIVAQEKRINEAQKLRKEERKKLIKEEDTDGLNRNDRLKSSLAIELQGLALLKEQEALRLKALQEKKKSISEIKKEEKDAAEAQKLFNKLYEEQLKNQESLRKQMVDEQTLSIKAIEDKKLESLSLQNIDEDKFARQRIELEIDTTNQLLAIAELNYEERAKLLEKLSGLTVDLNRNIVKSNTDAANKDIKEANDLADSYAKAWTDANDNIAQSDEELADKKKKINDTIRDQALNLANQIADAVFAVQRNNLQRQQDAETQALETQKEKALSSKRLTDAERDKLNKQFAAKELALKKKQFEETKRLSIAEAIIKGALAVVNALATGGPAAYILAAAVAAAVAVEIAVIASTKYAKGTKKAKPGMALVGEEGPEFMYVPGQAKILTAKQTKQNSKVIDAIYDNRLEKLIYHDHVLPALERQKANFNKRKEQSFADSLEKSLIFQGLTGKEMDKIRRKGTAITNTDELAEKIAAIISKGYDRRRQV